MTEEKDNNGLFRAIIGFIAVVGSFVAFICLYFVEIPAPNQNALMFAMGIVFGWGSSVFASEYGASNIGRKVAEGAVKRMEVDARPSGPPLTADSTAPQPVVVTNESDNPVPVEGT